MWVWHFDAGAVFQDLTCRSKQVPAIQHADMACEKERDRGDGRFDFRQLAFGNAVDRAAAGGRRAGCRTDLAALLRAPAPPGPCPTWTAPQPWHGRRRRARFGVRSLFSGGEGRSLWTTARPRRPLADLADAHRTESGRSLPGCRCSKA